MFIYSYDAKAEFSASLLQSSVSYDPSEIHWWNSRKHVLLLSTVVLHILEKLNFFKDSLINKSSKELYFRKTEYFVTL